MENRVGLIGLGTMGLPMARNILKGGYAISVYDIRPQQAQLLRREYPAAVAAPSVQAVGAACNTVITMLPHSAAVVETTVGAGGLFEAMAPGSTWVDMTTSDPSSTLELQQQAQRRGIHVVDAPVGRSPGHARRGELLVLAGGEGQVLDGLEPLFSTMASDIIRCGGTGSGHTMKLINNLLSGAIQTANVEALSLGLRAGISVSTMLRVFEQVCVWNGYLAGMCGESPSDPGWKAAAAQEHMEYVQKLALKYQVPAHCAAMAQERMAWLIAHGRGDCKYSSVTDLLSALGGIELARGELCPQHTGRAPASAV